ncbi:unnamed protein product, partial [Mesorhabditis belari]|uniref:Hydroxymethylglutaryl-CoA synthase n=1 Tax=Mesorhabditis belari TaxID=2138241 RepID=A0AAF3J9H4_9BILA
MIPENVGIRGIEVYYPRLAVRQDQLEKSDAASTGKYTIGLGQNQMAFFADQEDVVSIALTVTQKLIESYQISKESIGFLAVGTETLIDKSKSVKSELMRLFDENHDIEGVDVKNACYGGTQAVFHAIDWVTANWATEGRFSIAVLADIAVYEEGPARCTGGAGAVAVLIGPNAPIVFEKGLRGIYMDATWDFYKPIGGGKPSEYPVVNGQNSLKIYMKALDECYTAYKRKAKRLKGEEISLQSFDAAMFHSPFTKMVQKAIGRLHYWDVLNGFTQGNDELKKLMPITDLDEREVVSSLQKSSFKEFNSLTSPFLEMNRNCGNMYTPSLFVQLVTWLAKCASMSSSQSPARILMYAYGSGCASAMFSVLVNNSENAELLLMKKICAEALERLNNRTVLTPERYREVMKMREELLHSTESYTPKALSQPDLQPFPGAFILTSISKSYQRFYARIPLEQQNGHN